MKSDSEVTPDVPTGAKTGQNCGHYRRRHGDKFWDIYGHALKPGVAAMTVFTLWKDADPDIPFYKEAKAEYAKLQ